MKGLKPQAVPSPRRTTARSCSYGHLGPGLQGAHRQQCAVAAALAPGARARRQRLECQQASHAQRPGSSALESGVTGYGQCARSCSQSRSASWGSSQVTGKFGINIRSYHAAAWAAEGADGGPYGVLRRLSRRHRRKLFYAEHTLAREFVWLWANFHAHLSKACVGKQCGEIRAEIQRPQTRFASLQLVPFVFWLDRDRQQSARLQHTPQFLQGV